MSRDSKSLRNTHQRRLVLDIVKSSMDHPNAGEIYERAREIDPTISKGTVYRNLNLLSEMDEIKRLPMPVGPDHFDNRTTNHYHFICRECYRVVDVEIPYFNSLESNAELLPGFVIENHRLVLTGLCADCREIVGSEPGCEIDTCGEEIF